MHDAHWDTRAQSMACSDVIAVKEEEGERIAGEIRWAQRVKIQNEDNKRNTIEVENSLITRKLEGVRK